jgi:asparagine synthase (glutamine-hydrolysing)
MALPPELKTRGYTLKALLKAALKDILPKPILNARKQGFMIPLGTWLREDLYGYLMEMLDTQKLNRQGIFYGHDIREIIQQHQAGADRADILWALLVFQVWLEQNKL